MVSQVINNNISDMVIKGGVTYKQKGIGIVPVNPNQVTLNDYHKQLLDKIEDNTIKEFRKNLLLSAISDINLYEGMLEGKTKDNYALYKLHDDRLSHAKHRLDVSMEYLKEYKVRRD